jgi:type I restriction enzyme S subunit
MKQGWELKKLGEVCEISTGKSNTEDATENGEYAFFDRSKVIKKSSNYLFDCAAIIVAGEGQTFLPKFYSGKFALHQRAYAIFNFNCKVNIDYAFKYLIHFHTYFEKVAVGATVKSLRLRHFQDLPIPIPPLSEQERIVSILDQAFSAIEQAKINAEKNLKNAKELFDSYLTSVFTNKGHAWEEKTLGEVCVVERGSSPRPIDNFLTNSEDGVNWIKIGDTKGIDKYLYKTKEKITKEGAQKSRFVKEGDFILSNSMSFGKPYIMKTKGYIHDGWFVLRLPSNIHPEFFWYLLASPYTMSQFIGLASGAIVKNISGDLVKKTKLPIPPFEEQKEIAQKLDALSAETKQLEVIYQQKLTELEDLKKSILQKAFKGELKRNKI